MQAAELEDILYNDDNGLLIKLWQGQGINETSLAALYEALEEIKLAWRDKTHVPKDLVFVLNLIASEIALRSYNYEGSENYEIRLLANNLSLAIESCLSPAGSNNLLYRQPLKDIYCEPPGSE